MISVTTEQHPPVHTSAEWHKNSECKSSMLDCCAIFDGTVSGSCVPVAPPPQLPSHRSLSAQCCRPLIVDTSVEYEMSANTCPPAGSSPLLMVHPQYHEYQRHCSLQHGYCTCKLCRFYHRPRRRHQRALQPLPFSVTATQCFGQRRDWHAGRSSQYRCVRATTHQETRNNQQHVLYEQQRSFMQQSGEQAHCWPSFPAVSSIRHCHHDIQAASYHTAYVHAPEEHQARSQQLKLLAPNSKQRCHLPNASCESDGGYCSVEPDPASTTSTTNASLGMSTLVRQQCSDNVQSTSVKRSCWQADHGILPVKRQRSTSDFFSLISPASAVM